MRRQKLADLSMPEPMRQALSRFLRDIRGTGAAKVLDVVLYGSVARGEQRPDSDVDLLIEWQGPEGEGRRLMAEVTTDIFLSTGVLLNAHVLSPDRWNQIAQIQTAFHENVTREGISVVG